MRILFCEKSRLNLGIVIFEDFEALKKVSKLLHRLTVFSTKALAQNLDHPGFFFQKYGLLSFNNRETAEIQQTSST
jgi:hypothetical protein